MSDVRRGGPEWERGFAWGYHVHHELLRYERERAKVRAEEGERFFAGALEGWQTRAVYEANKRNSDWVAGAGAAPEAKL